MNQGGQSMTRTGWILGLLLALVVLPRTAQGQPGDSSVRLSDITVDAAKVTTVQIWTSGAAKYRAELLDKPPRLVIDLQDTSIVAPKTLPAVSGDPIRKDGETVCWHCIGPGVQLHDLSYVDVGEAIHWPCEHLRLLALPYAHRPGYQPEWAPDGLRRDDQAKRAYADDQQ